MTKDVPDFSIVVGNPARIIGQRLTEQERDVVSEKAFWLRPPEEILHDVAAENV
ncbi:hypothetical protein [Arthrobacter sp. CJ23]|uniref:hypothetical protein n=1 Tax=Arthrobacter sp. CJ23 TaxID=2972479 RepID=UPI002852C96A|nr:hypothetical protein [Arthrobacter sp. CJ23]